MRSNDPLQQEVWNYTRATLAMIVAALVTIATVSSIDFIPYINWTLGGLGVAILRSKPTAISHHREPAAASARDVFNQRACRSDAIGHSSDNTRKAAQQPAEPPYPKYARSVVLVNDDRLVAVTVVIVVAILVDHHGSVPIGVAVPILVDDHGLVAIAVVITDADAYAYAYRANTDADFFSACWHRHTNTRRESGGNCNSLDHCSLPSVR
jgi:hypothetical protein